MSIFFEVHQDLPREGPGSPASTRRAFELVKGLPDNPHILDIGCGPGMQTLELARLAQGKVIAIDRHEPFLADLSARAEQAELGGRIEPRQGDMFALDFPDDAFDLIWSEGAIYIIGFERGLHEWRRCLKPGGYLAVSEISWIKPDPPQELKEFWLAEYPAMQDVDGNLAVIRQAGYDPAGHFVMPESDWWDYYYTPLEKRLEALRQKYRNDPAALSDLEGHQVEIDLYRKYSDYYSYGFYIMRKPT